MDGRPDWSMHTIGRRLKQLEHARRMQIPTQSSGARERIMAQLDRIRERMMAGEDWTPEQLPDPEEVKQRIQDALAHLRGRRQ